MPNYEYECTECAKRFEIWQSVGESAPPCPECGSAVRKVFHPIRTIYKGSGFYITDSRSESSTKSSTSSESKTEAPGKTETPAPAAASTESTAAKTTDS